MRNFLSLLLGLTLGVGIMGTIESYYTYDRLYKQCRNMAYDKGIAKLQVLGNLIGNKKVDGYAVEEEAGKASKQLDADLASCESWK